MDVTLRSPLVVLNFLLSGFFSGMIEEAGLCYRRGWGYFPDFDVVHALFFSLAELRCVLLGCALVFFYFTIGSLVSRLGKNGRDW